MTLKRFAFGLAIAALLIALAAALWWYRPWSEYSPAEVYGFSVAQDRKPAYRAMETIYPHRVIAASPTPYAFPRAGTEIDTAYVTDGERRTLEDYASRHETTGFMVVHDGEVVLERYFGGEGPDDRHTSWSVAKSVIATLIGRALMEGEIESLDDPAQRYASEYEGTPFGSVSIRHLLMMSSGIDFDEDYEVEGSDIRKLFFGTFFRNEDVDAILRPYEQDRPAGEVFDYISANTSVLAAVLRGAYDGTPVAKLAEAKVFAPLGMGEGTWLTDSQDTGPGGTAKELGYCCLQVTLEDYAKLGQLYLQDGVVGRTRVVPEGWAEFVSTPPQPSHEPGGDNAFGRQGYGHHFWIPLGGNGAYAMQGYNGQIVWIDPANDTVIAMTSADPTWPGEGAREWVEMLRTMAERASSAASVGSGAD
jgi:CubicO group peptidase (beta-lactamase class C family)